MQQAFTGLKVLDFTTTIAGPYCTRLLADLGAQVTKIESDEGDVMRSRPPLRNGASTVYGQLNAGKRSVELDLKSDKAHAVIAALVREADIVVENFRPGVMARFKLDYPRLAAINPRLIYCSISGYGQTGPGADQPAYAPTVHAASGFDRANMAYQPGRTRPDYCGVFVADVLVGTYAFGAIATALHQRASTQQGQHIDVSMLEAMLSLTLVELQGAQFEMPPPPKRPIFGPVETADGFIMLAIASERTFQNLARVAGREDWIADQRFAKYLDRRKHWSDLMDEVEVWSRTLSTEGCLAALGKANVPASAYRTVKEALADPQIAHRGALAEVRDAGGTFKLLNAPFRMSASPLRPGPAVADQGADTARVLAEAGFTVDDLV
jgi:crotonobetainyl-CoA:carnitine CoA-transferase CaiB-like acyl-CoA transferase